jgi:hypothetical protein
VKACQYVTNALHLQHTNIIMVATKTATLNLRIDPVLKEALRIASIKDHRSIANMVEIMIREHCSKNGISIPDQQELFGQDKS